MDSRKKQKYPNRSVIVKNIQSVFTNPTGKEINTDGLTDNLYKTLSNELTLIFLKLI